MKDQPRTVLETRRLRLEPVSERHAAGLYRAALASRVELLPWMPWARNITLNGTRQQTDKARRVWKAGHEFHFAVLEDDQVLGVIGLNPGGDRSAELHYWIRTDRAGRGYATEAGERVLVWGAEQLGLRTFTLWAGVENRASRRVAEKLRFSDVGPLPKPVEGGVGTFLAEGYVRSADDVKPLHG